MTKFTVAEMRYFNRIKRQVEEDEYRRNRLKAVRNIMSTLRGRASLR